MVEVIVRSGRQIDVQKLSYSERCDLKQRIDSLRAHLSNDSEHKHLVQDRSVLTRQLGKMETIIHRDDDLVARGVDKDRLKSEINRLDEQIVRHVPPARMQRTSEKNVNAFEKAVQASMHAMAPEVTQLCEKRKDLNMRLEPDNPSAGSLKEIVGE